MALDQVILSRKVSLVGPASGSSLNWGNKANSHGTKDKKG